MTDQAMKSLSSEIQFLAFSGWSPKQIEEKLGFRPYTIHVNHHDDLMRGYELHIARYEKMPSRLSGNILNITEKERTKRKRIQAQKSYQKRKEAGKPKKRTSQKKLGRPRLKESEDEKAQRQREAFHRWYERNREKQISIVKMNTEARKEERRQYHREYYKRKCLELATTTNAVNDTAFFNSEYLSKIS